MRIRYAILAIGASAILFAHVWDWTHPLKWEVFAPVAEGFSVSVPGSMNSRKVQAGLPESVRAYNLKISDRERYGVVTSQLESESLDEAECERALTKVIDSLPEVWSGQGLTFVEANRKLLAFSHGVAAEVLYDQTDKKTGSIRFRIFVSKGRALRQFYFLGTKSNIDGPNAEKFFKSIKLDN